MYHCCLRMVCCHTTGCEPILQNLAAHQHVSGVARLVNVTGLDNRIRVRGIDTCQEGECLSGLQLLDVALALAQICWLSISLLLVVETCSLLLDGSSWLCLALSHLADRTCMLCAPALGLVLVSIISGLQPMLWTACKYRTLNTGWSNDDGRQPPWEVVVSPCG